MKQLLILPDAKKFTKAQARELGDAGFVVVYLPDPQQARVITPEGAPFSANQALLAALKAIRTSDSSTAYRTLVDGLIAASTPLPQSAAPQEARPKVSPTPSVEPL